MNLQAMAIFLGAIEYGQAMSSFSLKPNEQIHHPDPNRLAYRVTPQATSQHPSQNAAF